MDNLNQRIDTEWLLDRAKDTILIRGTLVTIAATDQDPKERVEAKIEAMSAIQCWQQWYLGFAVYSHTDPWRPKEPPECVFYHYKYGSSKLRDTLNKSSLWRPDDSLLGERQPVMVIRDGCVNLPDPRIEKQLIRMHERLIGRDELRDGSLKYHLAMNLAVRLQAHLDQLCG